MKFKPTETRQSSRQDGSRTKGIDTEDAVAHRQRNGWFNSGRYRSSKAAPGMRRAGPCGPGSHFARPGSSSTRSWSTCAGRCASPISARSRPRTVGVLLLLLRSLPDQLEGGPPRRRYFEGRGGDSDTHDLAEIDGRSKYVPAPEIAKRYWDLPHSATLRDVVMAVRTDEAHHRDVNHGFANELADVHGGAVAACPPHHELQPKWKQAA